MPKLTDDELGELLRETFADREALVDRLPAATKRPSRLPVLLAAAAVLAVLAGVLYGVSRIGAAAPEQPAATPAARTAKDDAQIWGAALDHMLRTVRPPAGWRSVIVLDLSDVGKEHARKGPPISAAQRALMTRLVRTAAPIQFHGDMPPAAPTCRDSRVGVVQIFDVVEKGDHAEADVALFHDCKHWQTAKYRVEKERTYWVVTATLAEHSESW
ncbi:hypothetical protein ACIA58_09270 [Kribbella sp. NPDC051586]|uniref:hypothetical protein n=1 Tax=Kribbella sp. NPDC051586 TaxID=3364118 RepID=UPI00378BCD0E